MLARHGKKFIRVLNQRGYVGPIGDDIPSLIPIVVGLLTFFAAFTFVLNEFNQRSASYAGDRDTLILANALKGDSYLSTYAEFEQACEGINVRGLSYVGLIVESSEWNRLADQAQQNGASEYLSGVADHIYTTTNLETGDTHPFVCSSGITTPFSAQELDETLTNHTHVILSFPVALELSTAVVPATLVVMTWRG